MMSGNSVPFRTWTLVSRISFEPPSKQQTPFPHFIFRIVFSFPLWLAFAYNYEYTTSTSGVDQFKVWFVAVDRNWYIADDDDDDVVFFPSVSLLFENINWIMIGPENHKIIICTANKSAALNAIEKKWRKYTRALQKFHRIASIVDVFEMQNVRILLCGTKPCVISKSEYDSFQNKLELAVFMLRLNWNVFAHCSRRPRITYIIECCSAFVLAKKRNGKWNVQPFVQPFLG